MNNAFLNAEHESRYKELIKKDKTHRSDRERAALFYILSSSKDLYVHSSRLYNFSKHWIEPDELRKIDFSSGTRVMIYLAFHLYNSFQSPNIVDMFSILDDSYLDVAINAIKLRFGRIDLYD